MSRMTAIVTGGGRGLGLVTARKMAAEGYRVVLTVRQKRSGDEARKALLAAVPGAEVEVMELDLASFDSIRAFAAAFLASGQPLHRLIHNAGLLGMQATPSLSPEGFELTFATNYVGVFLLTHLLLPALREHAPARIVIVSSSMHMPGLGRGPGPDFDYENLRAERSFHPVTAYRNSKLATMWFTYELARRLEGTGVTVNAVCPGFVPETIAATRPSAWDRFFFRRILPLFPFARSAEQGAGNTVHAATARELEGVSGKFIRDRKLAASSAESYDEQKARRLWDASMEWCGLRAFGERELA